MKKNKAAKMKTVKQKRAAQYLREHRSEIMLHTLYLRCGLPTALLKLPLDFGESK